MSKWYSEEYPETSEITAEQKMIRDRIVAILERHSVVIDRYDYLDRMAEYGICEDNYKDVAESIMKQMTFKEE